MPGHSLPSDKLYGDRKMSPSRKRANRAFSLIELIIVVVIIGIIAAIAIPRMSRGAAGAADAALSGDLAVMRSGIDLFAAEHLGSFPVVANIVLQLTGYSDAAGGAQATKDATHIYGPYLRAVPPLPVQGAGVGSGNKGDTTIAASAAAGVGWIYTDATGVIIANTGTAADDAGTLYTAY